ncbi:hypothetical protein CJ030_MR6G025622 [Morella rubra]|uniref:Uncharacterized protein n=1 Tax=Morella rubra TaxID=262757 RepID=A0A6A1VFW9_9ROSI|nr:hypothetical protein CJ030_MR6G025622 [Morella rubra]
MAANGDSVIIDAAYLASSIRNMMPFDLHMTTKCCIFKIPNILYRQNERAFIPDAFSIGPLHHDDLKATEKIKLEYLQCLISRLATLTALNDLINCVKDVEREARECYAEPIKYSPEEFVKILVIDGCFLIEVFRKNVYKFLKGEDDPIFSMSSMIQFLYHDLILLENQVPWIVLERLFEFTKGPEEEYSLTELAVKFFGMTFSMEPPDLHPIQDIKHIVDLLRKWLISAAERKGSGEKEEEINQPYRILRMQGIKHILGLPMKWLISATESVKQEVSSTEWAQKWEPIPSASSLKEAGIKFKKCKSKSILDVEFSDGVLTIPSLLVQEITETTFRNLISFEQCYANCEARLTSYAILIDNLINTTKDVDILRERGIVNNWLNPEDAVQFFNQLYHHAYVTEFHYGTLCSKVNKHCRQLWPRWRALLVHNYFNSPWTIISTVAAIILLVLSVLQTWSSMKT